jgi:hypothetical protein
MPIPFQRHLDKQEVQIVREKNLSRKASQPEMSNNQRMRREKENRKASSAPTWPLP